MYKMILSFIQWWIISLMLFKKICKQKVKENKENSKLYIFGIKIIKKEN